MTSHAEKSVSYGINEVTAVPQVVMASNLVMASVLVMQ